MPQPVIRDATVFMGSAPPNNAAVVGYVEANALPPFTGGIPDVTVFTTFTEPATASGAVAGAPGSWTPAFATAPANLAACPPLTGRPTWTTGQYNLLANGTSHVHWNGTAWATGDAP